jgi:hypothetical protein
MLELVLSRQPRIASFSENLSNFPSLMAITSFNACSSSAAEEITKVIKRFGGEIVAIKEAIRDITPVDRLLNRAREAFARFPTRHSRA